MRTRRIGDISRPERATAVELIRSIFHAYGIPLPSNRILTQQLRQADRVLHGRGDLTSPLHPLESDALAVRLARDPLRVYRLAESIDLLGKRKPPSFSERLLDLSRYKRGSRQHWEQFLAAEYELFCAAEFALEEQRVSFIHSKTRSRFVTNVEFLLKHRWPVECKRPTSAGWEVHNIKEATAKIKARNVPGLVCVALEQACGVVDGFLEVEDDVGLLEAMRTTFTEFWKRCRNGVLAAIAESPVQGVIFHITRLTCTYDKEAAGLPVFRAAAMRDGTLIEDDVIRRALDTLEPNVTG